MRKKEIIAMIDLQYYCNLLTIQCNGKEILESWSHLVALYERNRCKDTAGLALLPKLKYEHISLSSFSKMRVDLATQVFLLKYCHVILMHIVVAYIYIYTYTTCVH